MDSAQSLDAQGAQLSRLDRARIRQLTQKRLPELLRLRFVSADEARYRKINDRSRLHHRALYMLAGITLITITLLVDYFVLSVPAEFFTMRSFVGIGIMVPVLLIAFTANTLNAAKPYSEPATTLAVAVCSLCMIYQRSIGFQWGIDIPATFIALPIFIGLMLCRLRWLPLLPLFLFIYSLTIASELNQAQPRDYQLAQIYSFTLLMTTILIGDWVVEIYNRITWLRREWLRDISSRDALTGLLNKREFNRELTRLFKLAAREKRPLTVAMLDVDHFKAYNDHYGHQSGDRSLIKIAEVMRARSRRGGDLAGRVGGEEFAIAWYGNDRITVNLMLDQLLSSVRALNITHEHTGTSRQVLTISAGVRWLIPDENSDPIDVIHEADMLLYESKQAGRDCFRMQ